MASSVLSGTEQDTPKRAVAVQREINLIDVCTTAHYKDASTLIRVQRGKPVPPQIS